MNEGQRFLRYITPGITFFSVILLLLVVIIPEWTLDQLTEYLSNKGIEIMLGSLLVSGVLGYLFSILYHSAYWKLFVGRKVNHAAIIGRLRRLNLVHFIDADSGICISDDVPISQQDAWIIASALWYERKGIKESADERSSSISDLVHSTGTSFIASLTAWISAIGIACCVASFSLELEPIVRFLIANILAFFLIGIQFQSFKRLSFTRQNLVDQILHDAIAKEEELPIKTHVTLNSRR